MTVATTSSNAPDTAALLERAAAMRPVLERNADTTDALRRLADENVAALRDAGLCRLMVPARFGGYQTSIRTYIEVMAEAGPRLRIHGLGGEPDQRLRVARGALSGARAADVWGDGSRTRGLPARWRRTASPSPVDGGWRVTGRWPWASGSLHAQWVACGIHMKDERGEMANFGLSLMPMRERDDRGHLVHGRDEGHRQQHDRRQRCLRAGAPLPAVSAGAFAGQYRTEHTDEAVYRAALVPVTVLILAGVAARRGARRARPRGREGPDARHHAHDVSHVRPIRRASRCSWPRRR